MKYPLLFFEEIVIEIQFIGLGMLSKSPCQPNPINQIFCLIVL